MRISSRATFTSLAVSLGVIGVLGFMVPAHAAYGDVSTFLGRIYTGDGLTRTQALLDFPEDLEIGKDGTFFIADTYNNVIRKVRPNGIVSTYAGTGEYGYADGKAAVAQFAQPRGLAFDSKGNLFVADSANNRIRKIAPTGVVTTVVGSGLSNPQGVVVSGSTLYIADTGGNAIRKVSTTGGKVFTLTKGVKTPKKLTLAANGNLYIADTGSHRVLELNVKTNALTVVAGSTTSGYVEGIGGAARFQNVAGVARDGNTLYVTDGNGLTDYVRTINLTTRETALFATDFRMMSLDIPMGIRIFGGSVYVANSGIGTIHRYSKTTPADEEDYIGSTRFGNVDGVKANVLLGRPAASVITKDGGTMYAIVNNQIKRISLATGQTSTIIGGMIDDYVEGAANGSPAPRFSSPGGLVLSPDETALYIADRWNNRIRKVTLTGTPTSSLVTGAGYVNANGATNNGYQEGARCVTQLLGQAGCAYFRGPMGIVISPDGSTLYVADSGNHRIRMVSIADGQTSLLAGSGATGSADGIGVSASFVSPSGLALTPDGTTLYVADTSGHRIRSIDVATRTVATLAGSRQGNYEGIGNIPAFSLPTAIALGPNNLLYVADFGLTVVNTQTKLVTHVAGGSQRGSRNGSRFAARFMGISGVAVTPDGSAVYASDGWNDLIRKIDVPGTPKFFNPAPKYTSLSKSVFAQSKNATATARVLIAGKNIVYGMQVTVGPYVVSSFLNSSTSEGMILPLGKMKPGLYDLKLKNADTQQVIVKGALAVTDATGKVPSTRYTITQ